jgi:hypothetical protein
VAHTRVAVQTVTKSCLSFINRAYLSFLQVLSGQLIRVEYFSSVMHDDLNWFVLSGIGRIELLLADLT